MKQFQLFLSQDTVAGFSGHSPGDSRRVGACTSEKISAQIPGQSGAPTHRRGRLPGGHGSKSDLAMAARWRRSCVGILIHTWNGRLTREILAPVTGSRRPSTPCTHEDSQSPDLETIHGALEALIPRTRRICKAFIREMQVETRVVLERMGQRADPAPARGLSRPSRGAAFLSR